MNIQQFQKDLSELDNEIKSIENKYNTALNYIYALRYELGMLLKAISINNIDGIKTLYTEEGIKERSEYLLSKDVESDLKKYSYDNK